MVSEELKVINPSGLHLRPAGNLCKEALKYDSKIYIIFKILKKQKHVITTNILKYKLLFTYL